jgi:hypothetical protein
MVPRLIVAAARALREVVTTPDVAHVHPGAAGATAVCHDPRCLAGRAHRDTA